MDDVPLIAIELCVLLSDDERRAQLRVRRRIFGDIRSFGVYAPQLELEIMELESMETGE